MEWSSILLAGFSGGLGALLAQSVVPDRKKKKLAYTMVFVVAFVILHFSSRTFILPHLKTWEYQWKIESALQEMPVYREIAVSEPIAYRTIKGIMLAAYERGQSTELAIARSRAIIMDLLSKYAAHASDKALIDFANLLVREIETLTRSDPDVAFRFLFPQPDTALHAGKYLDEETIEEELNIMATIFRSARLNPQPKPDPSQAEPLVESVYLDLYKEYGDDLSLLANPHLATDRAKVCMMTVSFYRRILKMPKEESGLVLRYMFSDLNSSTQK